MVIGIAALAVAIATSGSSTTSPTVANVDGTKITLATFDHWLNSSAIAAHSSSSTVPPFVPDAPHYTRCIAFVSAAQAKAGKHPTDASLLTDCRQLRTAFAEEVMELLISSQWILRQGAAEGITVTPAQIQHAVHSSLPKSGLTSYLKGNGLSPADLTFEAKVSLIAQKLGARHAGPAPTITEAQIEQFYTANKSALGTATLAQATPEIKQELVAEAQAPTVEKYLGTVQKRLEPHTTCAAGYRIAYYCATS